MFATLRRRALSHGLALAVLASLVPAAHAQHAVRPVGAEVSEHSGVRLPKQVDMNGQLLQLNGSGIRYKAFFKVYAAGLYLPVKASTTDLALGQPGAKRIHIEMLRDIDARELGKLFTQGVEANVTREEFGKALPGILRIGELFAIKKRLDKGESFSVDWVPNVGAVISINGKDQGEPIKEQAFFNSLAKIWLGQNPADAALKDALLGNIKPANPRER